MSIANFEESGLVSQPVRSRSQLVTNRFLIALSQVFGLGAFTSRGISKRFGSDFLKTAKILSRMSKRPYYLLSAVHVTRPYGGYENSYTISTKGWSKISYLQRHSAPAPLPVEEGGSIILGASRAQIEESHRYPYLALGKGTKEEYTLLGIPPEVTGGYVPPIKRNHQANVGQIMMGVDSRILSLGLTCRILRGNGFGQQEPNFMFGGLQMLGFTPSDTIAPIYANAARYLGATNEEIIISILARRVKELSKLLDVEKQQRIIDRFFSESELRNLKLESNLQRESKVQGSWEPDELTHQATFLSELFIKVLRLESLTTDNYMKRRIDKVLNAIMESELSSLKRRYPTAA